MTFYLFILLRVNELYESLCKLLLVQPLQRKSISLKEQRLTVF